jgi:hypothetical protein
MNILEAILNAQGGGAVRQLGGQFGLDEGQTQSAISALLPMLAGAVNQNAASEGGLDSLLGALSGGNHQRYLDDPSALSDPAAIAEGNGILGHLFGSKEVSRQVASHASAQTGIGSDILKQMLPMVAGMMMGGLSRQSSGGGGGMLGALGSAAMGMMGGQASAAPQAAGLLGALTPLLDSNRDGSAMDDILGMAAKFLGGRR